jgi:hypothetical protein
MSTTITSTNTHIAVPISRYAPISESAEAVGKPECHEHAVEGYAKLIANHDKLRGEKIALENAQTALAAAKVALKSAQTMAKLVVPTAINMGKMLNINSIANFEPEDESWIESVEGLAARFDAHGEFGKGVAQMLRGPATQLRLAESTVERETDVLDRASQAFSATYRHLSNAVNFGRAVLKNLGVAVPTVSKTAGKKRKVAEVPAVKQPEVTPVPKVVLTTAA